MDPFVDGPLGSLSPFAGACIVPRPRSTHPFFGCEHLFPHGLITLQVSHFCSSGAQPFRNEGSRALSESDCGGVRDHVPLAGPRRHGPCSGPFSGREGRADEDGEVSKRDRLAEVAFRRVHFGFFFDCEPAFWLAATHARIDARERIVIASTPYLCVWV